MSDRKTIYVNSTNRSSGTNEDFIVTTTVQQFPLPPKSVKLVTASIPYTWDNITNGNNTFSIVQTAPPSPTNVTDNFVIPTGNYTGPTLAVVLQNLINASILLGQPYVVAYNVSTFTFTFSTVGPDRFQIVFGSAATLLGFAPGSTNPASPALSVTSTQPVQLVPDMEIFICSDLVEGSDNGIIKWLPSTTPSISSQTQILARIPVNVCYTEFKEYRAHDDLPFYTVTQSPFVSEMAAGKPASIRFFLAFPSGNPVNLHGYWWTAELVFDFNQA